MKLKPLKVKTASAAIVDISTSTLRFNCRSTMLNNLRLRVIRLRSNISSKLRNMDWLNEVEES